MPNIEFIKFKLRTSQESTLVYAFNVYLSQAETILSEEEKHCKAINICLSNCII